MKSSTTKLSILSVLCIGVFLAYVFMFDSSRSVVGTIVSITNTESATVQDMQSTQVVQQPSSVQTANGNAQTVGTVPAVKIIKVPTDVVTPTLIKTKPAVPAYIRNSEDDD